MNSLINNIIILAIPILCAVISIWFMHKKEVMFEKSPLIFFKDDAYEAVCTRIPELKKFKPGALFRPAAHCKNWPVNGYNTLSPRFMIVKYHNAVFGRTNSSINVELYFLSNGSNSRHSFNTQELIEDYEIVENENV